MIVALPPGEPFPGASLVNDNVVEVNCTQDMLAPKTTFPTGEPFTKYTPGPAVLLTDTTA